MKTLTVKILTRSATRNPQDDAVGGALQRMGYTQMQSILVGRFLIIEVNDDANIGEWIERLQADLRKSEFAEFFNPVTDTCEIEVG